MSGSLMVIMSVVSVLARQVASLCTGSGEWGMGNGEKILFATSYPHSLLPTPHSPFLTDRRRIPHSTPSNNNLKDYHCMRDRTFSLFHQVAPPKGGLESKPPLLLLLHGYGANEDDLFSLAPYLDGRFMIVSARAPIMLQPMSYAWFNLGFTPQGIVVNLDEVESSRRTIHKFIGEIVEAYDCDPKSVYLMGFSQGAMLSLAVAL